MTKGAAFVAAPLPYPLPSRCRPHSQPLSSPFPAVVVPIPSRCRPHSQSLPSVVPCWGRSRHPVRREAPSCQQPLPSPFPAVAVAVAVAVPIPSRCRQSFPVGGEAAILYGAKRRPVKTAVAVAVAVAVPRVATPHTSTLTGSSIPRRSSSACHSSCGWPGAGK